MRPPVHELVGDKFLPFVYNTRCRNELLSCGLLNALQDHRSLVKNRLAMYTKLFVRPIGSLSLEPIFWRIGSALSPASCCSFVTELLSERQHCQSAPMILLVRGRRKLLRRVICAFTRISGHCVSGGFGFVLISPSLARPVLVGGGSALLVW